MTRARKKALIDGRDAAIGQMNTALRKKLQQIERQADDLRSENIKYYFALGHTLLAVRGAPETYGENAYGLLEAAMPLHSRSLRRAISFAQAYTQEDVDELCGMCNEAMNFKLHWGHVGFLLTLNSPTRRRTFAQRAIDQLLDPGALHALIKRDRGTASRGGGRTHAMPRTLAAQIRQMLETTRIWNNKRGNVWDGADLNALNNIMASPPDSYTDAHLGDLRAVVEQLRIMRAGVDTMLARLDPVIAHVDTVLQQRPTILTPTESSSAPDPAVRPARRRRAVDVA